MYRVPGLCQRKLLFGVPSSELPRSTLPKSVLIAAFSTYATGSDGATATATEAAVAIAAAAAAVVRVLRRMVTECRDQYGRTGIGLITPASLVTYVTWPFVARRLRSSHLRERREDAARTGSEGVR